MKIVFLAPFGLRPKGTVLARMVPLAAELQRLGHSVTIIVPPYTNPEDSGRSEVVRGVTVRNIVLPTGGKALGAPLMVWRLLQATLAAKPDLIHLFKPKGYGGLAAMLLLLLRKAGAALPPLLVDTDDWEGKGGMNDLQNYSAVEKRLYAFQEQWLSRHAAGVTVASRALQTLTWGMGVLPERLLYLPNCVDDLPPGSDSGIRQKLGIPTTAPVLLLYTRFFEFSQEKLHLLFAEIHRTVHKVRFLVIGTGRQGEEERLVAAGRKHGFSAALVMAGWVEPGDLPGYLAVGDVAIYPFADTLVNRAKCPAKLTELLRAGIPVVAHRVGQLAEYIKPGVSGVLCDPDDWQEMAHRVVELLADPTARQRLGAAGREYLLTRFSWQQAATSVSDFYRIILRNPSVEP